jgi:hypothetical protein
MVANVGRLAAQRRVLQGIAEDPVPVGKCAANVAKRALHAHNVRCRATGAWPSMRGYLTPATLPVDLVVMRCPERRGGTVYSRNWHAFHRSLDAPLQPELSCTPFLVGGTTWYVLARAALAARRGA